MHVKLARRSLAQDYKYPSLLIDIPEDLKEQIKELQKLIPRKYVDYFDEDDLHVTLLYSIRDKGFERDLSTLIKGKTFDMELDGFDWFDNDEESVFFIKVKSPQLKSIHNTLKSKFTNDQKPGDYKPHLTIAYMKSRDEEFDWEPDFDCPDFEWTAEEIVISYEEMDQKLFVRAAKVVPQLIVINRDGDLSYVECPECKSRRMEYGYVGGDGTTFKCFDCDAGWQVYPEDGIGVWWLPVDSKEEEVNKVDYYITSDRGNTDNPGAVITCQECGSFDLKGKANHDTKEHILTCQDCAYEWDNGFDSTVVIEYGDYNEKDGLDCHGHNAYTRVPKDVEFKSKQRDTKIKLARKANKENVAKPEHLKTELDGVGLGKDQDGYYVYTHRSRSDSYVSADAIPKGVITEIESTGGKKKLARRSNLAAINFYAAPHGLQLARGEGYFFWFAINHDLAEQLARLESTSVYVNSESDISFEEWMESMHDILRQVEALDEYELEKTSDSIRLSRKSLAYEEDEVVAEGEWAKLVIEDETGYEYLSSDPGVAVLLFRTDNEEKPYLCVFEEVPAHDDPKPILHSLTGTIDNDDPIDETAVREVKEEAGYDITKEDLIELGEIQPAKNTDWHLTMYAVDITNMQEGERTTDGTEIETEAFTKWVSKDEILESDDAILHSMLLNLEAVEENV